MCRHPVVSKRVAQNFPTSRNQVTEEKLRAWFDRVRTYFEENDLLQVFQGPKRITYIVRTTYVVRKRIQLR